MWALIKREVEDMAVYVILYLFASISISGLLIYGHYEKSTRLISFAMTILTISLFAVCFVSTAFGVTQMAFDRAKKISTFLVSYAVTREHILSARIIAGALIQLLFYMPLLALILLLNSMDSQSSLSNVYGYMFLRLFSISILSSLCCYVLGLVIGHLVLKDIFLFGTIIMTALLMTFFIVKGFSGDLFIILILFILMALSVAWQNFRKTTL